MWRRPKATIFKMPKLTSQEALDYFERNVGRKVENSHLLVLFKDFRGSWEAMKSNLMDKNDCIQLMKLLQAYVKSETKVKVMNESGIIFGEAIGNGQGRTFIMEAFSQSSNKHYAAKMYFDPTDAHGKCGADIEFLLSQRFHHENICKIEKLHRFDHSDGTKGVALLMSRYLLSLKTVMQEVQRGASFLSRYLHWSIIGWCVFARK